MREVVDEFCMAARNEGEGASFFDYFSDFRALCGYPNSSEETLELISLLQTEQSLLHHKLALNPGAPSVGALTYINRLKKKNDRLAVRPSTKIIHSCRIPEQRLWLQESIRSPRKARDRSHCRHHRRVYSW
jgi:hypothetical protein